MRVLEELLQRILEQLKIANQLKELELKYVTHDERLKHDVVDDAMDAKW